MFFAATAVKTAVTAAKADATAVKTTDTAVNTVMTLNFQTYIMRVFTAVTVVFTAEAAENTDETAVTKTATTSVKFSSHRGNSTSKTPSLQSVSLKLAEILQTYSILKGMILCKISAPKSESEFFKFSLFFASFLARLFNFDVSSPKSSEKISKTIFSM